MNSSNITCDPFGGVTGYPIAPATTPVPNGFTGHPMTHTVTGAPYFIWVPKCDIDQLDDKLSPFPTTKPQHL